MARITVDIDAEWLDAAQHALGTESVEATVSEALRAVALRRTADTVAAFDGVSMDFAGSGETWRYGGGRDLDRLEADARGA